MTYDDVPEIRAIYARYPMFSSRLNYFAQVKRAASEILVVDPTLKVPRTLLAA